PTTTLYPYTTLFRSKFSNPIKNTTRLINKNSYYIYLVHQPVLMITYGTGLLLSSYTWHVIPIVFTIGFLASFLIATLLMKHRLRSEEHTSELQSREN